MSETHGFIQVVIDVKTNQILGCAILLIEAGEMSGTDQMAMIAGLPFTALPARPQKKRFGSRYHGSPHEPGRPAR